MFAILYARYLLAVVVAVTPDAAVASGVAVNGVVTVVDVVTVAVVLDGFDIAHVVRTGLVVDVATVDGVRDNIAVLQITQNSISTKAWPGGMCAVLVSATLANLSLDVCIVFTEGHCLQR